VTLNGQVALGGPILMKELLGTLFRGLVCVVLVVPCLSGHLATADEWSVNDVLKQIDKATKGVHALTGEVTLTDQQAGVDTESMDGNVSIRLDGRIRLEAEGDNPKTVLCIPGKMFVYESEESVVTEYPLAKHPDKLAQYTLIGFSTRGAALKKDYLVTLVGEDDLDGHSVVILELTPKSDQLRASVSKIQVWTDQATWLPIQQRIFHGGAETHLTVRYANLSRNDKLSNDPFAPKWPKGTQKQKP
jgi:outer membrane lipoprotein-sorting protein